MPLIWLQNRRKQKVHRAALSASARTEALRIHDHDDRASALTEAPLRRPCGASRSPEGSVGGILASEAEKRGGAAR